MKQYNVGIVGFGGMANYHAKHLIKLSERLVVRGCFDIREIRQQAAIEAGYIAYPSFEAMLQDEMIEVVLVATPNDVHKSFCIQALQAHKHVVCEKPVTLNTQELKDILTVADETGYVFMVHQNRRWDEDFLTMKQIYDEKLIGDCFEIESRVQGANGIPGDWRHEKQYGGGMVLDWGVHLFDQVLAMIDSKITSVYSTQSIILGNDVDDGFQTIMTFENGVKATIEVGTTNFIQLPRWYVKGTEGTAILKNWDLEGHMVMRNHEGDYAAPKAIKAGQGLTKTMAPPSEKSTLTKDLPKVESNWTSFYENFVAVIENKEEPRIKNEQVLRVMNLIDTVFESIETNQVMKDFDLW